MDDRDILLAVGELKGSHEAIADSLNRFAKVIDKVDTRLSDVEKKQAKFAGYAAGAGAAGGALIVTMAKKIGLT